MREEGVNGLSKALIKATCAKASGYYATLVLLPKNKDEEVLTQLFVSAVNIYACY